MRVRYPISSHEKIIWSSIFLKKNRAAKLRPLPIPSLPLLALIAEAYSSSPLYPPELVLELALREKLLNFAILNSDCKIRIDSLKTVSDLRAQLESQIAKIKNTSKIRPENDIILGGSALLRPTVRQLIFEGEQRRAEFPKDRLFSLC